jgi:hypothetical protein
MKIRQILSAAIVGAAALSGSALAQVTSVGQLRDVQPTDWSYSALSNLVARYGCVAGYPNGTFKSGQPATRAELAALTNACLDNITQFYTEADARTAAALRAEFSREIAKTNTRVTALEVRNEAKDKGVGTYLGAAVTLNRQGVNGGGYDSERTVAGAALVGRVPVATLWGNEVSIRPYLNAAAGPNSRIGAAAGALATYDWSISKSTLADGSTVSNTNVYLGGGGQWALTNGGQANRQASIGEGSQAVFVTGIERRISNKFVAFGDLIWPTQNDGVRGTAYSPVGRIGAAIKF